MEVAADNPSQKDSSELLATGVINLQSRDIPYAYFLHTCGLEKVMNVVFNEWNLQSPSIILMIVSANEVLEGWPDFKQQDKFVQGLIKASNDTNMWILTNGFNIGISKVIGDAFNEDYNQRYALACYGHSPIKTEVKNTPLIGICREHFLTYFDKIMTKEKKIILQNTGNKPDERRFNLNPYHSHLLLMHDDSPKKGGIDRFLIKLEDSFRGVYYGQAGDDELHQLMPSSPVPVIAVLVQGDLNSVNYILSHLKRKCPVLVIRGSGGLADLLSYAYYEVLRSPQKFKDAEYVENILKQSLSDRIKTVFPSVRDNKVTLTMFCDKILSCIQYAEPPSLKYLTVFNMLDLDCGTDDIPTYLLETLFKSQKSDAVNFHEQLKRDLLLTIDWNCPELACTKVFYKDPTFKVANDIFEQTLLKEDREEFISLFLDNGFEIHKYMNSSRVITLFEHALKESFFREVCWEGVLGYRRTMMLDDYFIDSDLNWIIANLLGIPIYISSRELDEFAVGIFNLKCPKSLALDVAKRKSLNVLIIWALITNRGKLAVYLWRHVDHPVMMSLTCSMLLEKLKQYINEKTLQDNCAELSRKFADMAVGVFDLCYNDMPSKAYDCLSLKNEEWGGYSVIDMAAFSMNRDLVAHPCCQKWLTNTFMGNIKIRDWSMGIISLPDYIKVILCAFFIFPMYLWVRFEDSTEHNLVDSNEYVENYPYSSASESLIKEKKKGASRSDIGGTHLLKYYYPPLWQMIFWMWSAPITKFWVSNIFYVIYLALFSLAVVWTGCGNYYLDLAICLWTSLIAFDSAHRLYALKKAYPNTQLFGKVLEVIYILMFVLFVFYMRIFRATNPYSAKIIMCLGLLCFYYRMIFIYLPISSTLGPLLYRVKEMVTVDFVNFMKLVSLILIANGLAMQAVVYPDYPLIIEMVRMMFHKAIIAFFITPVGELAGTEEFCETWEQKPSDRIMCRVSNYIDGKCSSGVAFWPYIIVFQYLLLLKLILLTILYALFANTGAKIGALSNVLWKSQRYHLVVKFSVSLRLPPPLNIFSLIGLLYQAGRYLYRRSRSKFEPKSQKSQELSFDVFLPAFEYNYWRQLARDYYEEQNRKKSEEEYTKNEVDIIAKLIEDVNLKEDMIYRARSQIAQLESDINYTHAHLETLKYREIKDEDGKTSVFLHALSRETPYYLTKIQRFPVPDKYVPWEVMWLNYEPSIYTRTKEEFELTVQPFVDEDILGMKQSGVKRTEIPNYSWNVETTDSAGVYHNRKSWIIDAKGQGLTYRLDNEDLPQNPKGRTGMRGKGSLPRWGPNHNLYVAIFRVIEKTAKGSDHSLLGTSDKLEMVQTWHLMRKNLSLPGGFAFLENRYSLIQNVFKMAADAPVWADSDDMITFFRQHSTGTEDEVASGEDFKFENITTDYMDDQLNTDNAWKEVDLWLIHYNNLSTLESAFKADVKWKLLTEDTFVQLPYGQTALLQDVIRVIKTFEEPT